MVKQRFNSLHIGDIHLGHPRNKTHTITSHLRQFFQLHHKIIVTANVIFIMGDIFHKLLNTNSEDYLESVRWLTELVMYCKANNIKLRVLEGTPGHDWKQASAISIIIKNLNINIDYKYIDTLTIETMNEYGYSFLYIPDEYRHNANDTYKEVLKLMQEHGLSKVDFVIMHGQFNYQLPMVKTPASHDEESYLLLTEHYITAGHIHTASVFDRILAEGSIDRVAHGEEEDKGGIFISIREDGSRSYKFIKNPYASIYKTYRYKTDNVDTILKRFEKDIKELPIGSHVRLLVPKTNDIAKSKLAIKAVYPDYDIQIEYDTKDKNELKTDIVQLDKPVDSFQITRENIIPLLDTELSKHNLSIQDLSIIHNELELVMNAL